MMTTQPCFFGKCHNEVKSGIIFGNGTEIYACEEHEDILQEEFGKNG